MKRSKTGQFYGVTTETIQLDGLTLTDTEYLHDKVDWHFHEKDYFTFILQGSVLEGNKKGVYECFAGDLLYHNWQDAHYNIGSDTFTRGFHVELEPSWYQTYDIDDDLTQGSIRIANPRIKTLMYNIFKEVKLAGQTGQPGIDALLIEIFTTLGKIGNDKTDKKPKWVGAVREILNDPNGNLTLTHLARQLNVHPVHLSREFPKHFNTTLGEYIRTKKVQRALTLLPDPDLSLTDIAFQCDFADQSHFIRSFRSYYAITPLGYRRLLQKKTGC